MTEDLGGVSVGTVVGSARAVVVHELEGGILLDVVPLKKAPLNVDVDLSDSDPKASKKLRRVRRGAATREAKRRVRLK